MRYAPRGNVLYSAVLFTFQTLYTVWPEEMTRNKISFLLKFNLDGISAHSGTKTIGSSQLFGPHRT